MTQGSTITDEIRRFVLTSVPSVPFVEGMLLLRADPAAQWTTADLARRLYIGEKLAAQLMQELREAGIAHQDAEDIHHYAPTSPGLDDLLGQLADAYSKSLVEITNLIHSRTSRKAQRLVDAFEWRKG
ncbi:hypothetical protein [Massilia endophytica]|uniref:hypothetical protein n=1 Tax=Massilia endophytica TaxID=2899220 RepID=UPI001E31FA9B|nr:hypothetical protein [Massilia endophytica]UGQ49095.1 hypothetical protein LSQ66_11715 [Massilia endophytica]